MRLYRYDTGVIYVMGIWACICYKGMENWKLLHYLRV